MTVKAVLVVTKQTEIIIIVPIICDHTKLVLFPDPRFLNGERSRVFLKCPAQSLKRKKSSFFNFASLFKLFLPRLLCP